jgi:hypothetical protein
MRTILIRLVLAAALATASWLASAEAALADRLGDAKQQIATLRFSDVDADLDAGGTLSDYLLPERRLSDDARVTKATVAYWLGQYGSVIADTGDAASDAEVLLAAANAAFREAQRGLTGSVVQRLDGVLNAYASALKASPRHSDAAYNYEFVARLRDQLARTPGKGFKPPSTAPAAMAGDLPAGQTIHGLPGAPPPEAKMEELQMLAPMEYGDREAQPEATPGAKRERKG